MMENEDGSLVDRLIGKGRITAWIVLAGLFVLTYLGIFDSAESLKLIGYIVMAAMGAEAANRS